MGSSSTKEGFTPGEALRQAGQIGKYALSKLTRAGSVQARPQEAISGSSEPAQLDSVFKQHPDLFRDSSQLATDWNEINIPIYKGAIHTLFIREQHTTPLIREYLLSDSRLHMCAMAERLGDACRQIRQQSYQVIVLAISDRMQDMVSLLDLMNISNPRAKAVAVLENQAIAQLQNMIHPKVLGYVAAQDAADHLSHTVLEVSQGRFTASPAISEVIMRLTSHYLSEKTPVNKQLTASHLPTQTHQVSDAVSHQAFAASDFASSQLHSSFLQSAPSSSAFSEILGYSSRPKISKALLSEREAGILMQIAGGLSSAEIGQQLAISVPTVNTHIRNIFTKLGVHTRAQAIHVGMTQGMIEVE